MNKIFVVGITRRVGVLFLVYFSYLLMGSLFFVMLETTHDKAKRNRSDELTFLRRRMAIVLMEANYTDNEIHSTFLKEKEDREPVPNTLGWKQQFGDKVFFAFILITTIGYGNVAPKNNVEKVICIIYTILGIPLTIIMMQLLSFKFRAGLRMSLKIAQSIKPYAIYLLICFGTIFYLIYVIGLVLVPAYVFTLTEDWDYTEGLYFSFVTLSTIGLGDFVAGISTEQFKYYALNVTVRLLWMFFGIAFVTMALNMLSYFMGVCVMNLLDSRCQRRAAAKKRFQPLNDLLNDINWLLLKYKPENFKHYDDIEEIQTILSESPEEVTDDMLKNTLSIVKDLKFKAFDELRKIADDRTPVIEHSHDGLPEIISQRTTVVRFGPVTNLDSTSKLSNPKISDAGKRSGILKNKSLSIARKDFDKSKISQIPQQPHSTDPIYRVTPSEEKKRSPDSSNTDESGNEVSKSDEEKQGTSSDTNKEKQQ